ncbi:MAG: 50S ribosomal protein L25 [Deltaproteobacteria bacterium]|nr:50S ribosomal protein L25 [Deltaproteobacteria bacterium]
MNNLALSARIRTETGKGAARRLRQNKQVPAIFYGPGTDTVLLTLEDTHLLRLKKAGKGENAILDLTIETDQGKIDKKVMVKELVVDPVERCFMHADFYEISNDRELTLPIPILLQNIPVGVSEEGGILQQIRRELVISCFPDKLIESLEVDVAHLDIGDKVRIRDLELSEGIRAVDDGNLTVAVVNVKGAVEEEEVEAEEIEGEEGEATEETDGSAKETAEESKE